MSTEIVGPYPSGSATFSQCGRYRYTLTRRLTPAKAADDPTLRAVAFVGLNPSTADATTDDPTIRRCMRFAVDWGFDRLLMVNLFSWRATDPREVERMLSAQAVSPIHPCGAMDLVELTQDAEMIVAAWGASKFARERVAEVLPGLDTDKLHALRLTKDGSPAHPLYLPASLKPFRWRSALLGSG